MSYLDLELPSDNTVETRLEWAGERFADLAEGILPDDVGWFIYNVVIGWADLCNDNDRRQYVAMAGQISELLRSRQ